ncbi:hypothetical protein MJO29_011200 [Puccinia striiformis f. sp. tritici]|nr:hypothetical protein MJO29_011200 [Puccinia striiformis f. sp. tritici]
MIMGAGLGNDVACLTDSRFSGGYSQLHIFNFSFHNPTDRPHLTPFRSHGFCISHIVPKAVKGGPIGLLKDGDRCRQSACTTERQAARAENGPTGGRGRGGTNRAPTHSWTRNSNADGLSTLDLIVNWLTTEGNYELWRSGRQSKRDVAEMISE